MSASQSAVRSRAEEVKTSPTFDWMILFSFFLIALSGYHMNCVFAG